MSTFDDYALARRREAAAITEANADSDASATPSANHGEVKVLGVALIISGFLFLPVGLLSIAVGCFCFGGDKVVDKAVANTHQAATTGSAAAVHTSAGLGFGAIILYCLLAGFILIAVMGAMASSGLLPDCTVCGG